MSSILPRTSRTPSRSVDRSWFHILLSPCSASSLKSAIDKRKRTSHMATETDCRRVVAPLISALRETASMR